MEYEDFMNPTIHVLHAHASQYQCFIFPDIGYNQSFLLHLLCWHLSLHIPGVHHSSSVFSPLNNLSQRLKTKSHRWRSLIPEIFLCNINAFLSCFDCVSSRDSGWNKSELWRIIQFAEIRCLHSALSPPLSDNETLETNYNQIQITHFILQQTCQ